MDIKWNFPNNQNGSVNGIAEAGIETFKGAPLNSLAREICQNSLDARKDNRKPVIVEFKSSKMLTNDIPDISNLRIAIRNCRLFGEENKDKKTIDFFKKAYNVILGKEINILRISDFNTTGLTGSDKNYGTPWINLVKGVGVSNKSSDSGGSFGIGKSAPFSCSNIRTVFYSTLDEDFNKAHQGVSRLISYPINNLEGFTTGTGYYGKVDRNSPVPTLLSLDKEFNRGINIGTDIFIVGFNNEENWTKEIIESILDEFLLSIFNNDLEVHVNDIIINKDNLQNLIENFKETPGKAYNYYKVLTSPDTIIEEIPFEDLGSIKLYLLLEEDLHRRVLMSRNSGMKIFDNKGYSAIIYFAGICILQGEKLNAYFRDMENPQHNVWEDKRHPDPKAKAKKAKLNKIIREKLNSLHKGFSADEVDAEGLGKYLPEISLFDDGSKTKKNKENIKENKITFILKKVDTKKKNYTQSQPSIIEDTDGYFSDQEYVNGGSKDYGTNRKLKTMGDSSFGKNDGDGIGPKSNRLSESKNENSIIDDWSKQSQKEISSITTRLINLGNSKYRLIIPSHLNLSKSFVKVFLSGEMNNKEVNIVNAFENLTENSLKTNGNKIYIDQIRKNEKKIINFQIDYDELSSMDVKIYGNKE